MNITAVDSKETETEAVGEQDDKSRKNTMAAGKIQWQPENHEEFHVSDCTKRNEMLQYRHKI